MKAIIVISISIALLYGTEILFWAALINGLAHLIFNYMKAYIVAIPAMEHPVPGTINLSYFGWNFNGCSD